MNPVAALSFGALLIGLSAFLIYTHRRTWRGAQTDESLTDREYDYRRRQYRRRVQTSALLGVVGVCLVISMFIKPESRSVFVYYWFGTMVLVMWILALGVGDFLATRAHASHMRRDFQIERAKLEAQLRRAQAARSNGKAEHFPDS